MEKIFVLDTNVIIHNPNSIFAFKDSTVVIPITVLEEIDKFKNGLDEKSRNAREFGRIMDRLREKSDSDFRKGVPIKSGGKLFVGLSSAISQKLNELLLEQKNDNLIICTALHFKEKNPNNRVILVSKDVNVRIKADALGLEAQNFKNDQVKFDEIYTGVREIALSEQKHKEYSKNNYFEPSKKDDVKPNEFAIFRTEGRKSLARYSAESKLFYPLNFYKGSESIFGIVPRNTEQRLAMDLLLDPEVKLVTLLGTAGTGKTFLALAAGMEQVVQKGLYKKMVVSRPIFPMGKDIGFLPGSKKDKFNPWMQPIYDNMEKIIEDTEESNKKQKRIDDYIDFGLLELEPLTYIRGRSLTNQYLIVDEAQNLTAHEIKTIITRAGEKTKIIFTGDPYQIDVPYLDSESNGLSVAVEKLKEERAVGHVTLVKGERSELANIAARDF